MHRFLAEPPHRAFGSGDQWEDGARFFDAYLGPDPSLCFSILLAFSLLIRLSMRHN